MIQRYDKAFKEEAARLALTSSESISQAKERKENIPNGIGYLGSEQMIDELNRLRKENACLKEEREILKKAATFFAKEEEKRDEISIY